MPRVPTLDSAGVSQRAISSSRSNIGDIASRQIQQEVQSNRQVSGAIDTIANSALELGIKYKKNADSMRVTQTSKKAQDEVFSLVNDSEDGLLSLRGENSFGNRDAFEDSIAEIRQRYNDELGNEDQKAGFNRNLDRLRQKYLGQIERHTSTERQRFDKQQHESILTNNQDVDLRDALDEVAIQDIVALQRDQIIDYADRNGLDESVAREQLEESVSNTHENAILQLINAGDERTAEQRIKKFTDDLKPDARRKLTKVLEEGKLRRQSFSVSDKIIDKSDSLLDALQETRNIRDPELRERVERRVKQHFGDIRTAERQDREKNYLDASNLIDDIEPGDRNGLVEDFVDPELWDSLTPTQKKSLKSQFRPPRKTNESAWFKFNLLDGQELKDLSESEFQQKFLSSFNDSDRKKAIKTFSDAKKKDGVTTKTTKTQTFSSLWEDSLREQKILSSGRSVRKLSGDSLKQASFLKRRASDLIEQKEIELGRKMTTNEMRDVFDDLTIKKFRATRDGFFSDSEVEVSELDIFKDDEDLKLSNIRSIQGNSPTSRVPVKVPESESEKIRKIFIRKGVSNPTPAMIESVYKKKIGAR